jgi:hypothetical protein
MDLQQCKLSADGDIHRGFWGGSEASTTSIMSSRSNPFGERIAGMPTSSQRLRS